MRIVLVTGIWPPDVGGPATHGPDLARFLSGRGHRVVAVTMADGEVTERPVRVVSIRRALPFPARYGLVALRSARIARAADVLYASATYAAAAAAAGVAQKPWVAKLVSDPAYERARRTGLFGGSLEEFADAGAWPLEALRRARTAVLRRARRIVVPSAYLAEIALGWGLDERRVEVLPNPAPADRPESAEKLPRGTLVFAGRLTAQKGLVTALEALARVPAARLVLVGDGPDRAALEARARDAGLNGRVEFRGARPRGDVLRALAGAEAALLPSEWENLPHAAIEALAVGTPVVATAVGGVPEIVRDGENGLLVPPRDPAALAAAIERVLGDRRFRNRLAKAAAPSIAELDRERVYGRLEAILAEEATR
jgi:glycosyltransferase involved in cell wall biosynthesis